MGTLRGLLQLMIAFAVVQQGFLASAASQEARPAYRRAGQEITRPSERRIEEQGREQQADRRTADERIAEEAKRARADVATDKIDLKQKYNADKLDFNDLRRMIEADERLNDNQTTSRVARREGQASQVIARESVDLARFVRLNKLDKGDYKLKPHEAWAAAEFERYWGQRLERSPDGRVDYIISDGAEKGKKVDFMLTETVERSAEINEKFDKRDFAISLRKHVDKADLVPIETRFLTEGNQRSVIEEIDKLRPDQQQKIIIIKRD